MSEQVQVREGVWRTREGEEVEVRARDLTGIESSEWRWEGKRHGHMVTWRDDGMIHIERRTSNGDLMQFLRPLPGTEPEPVPVSEPQPVQVRAGIWKTRSGREVEVRERDANGPTRFRWEGLVCGVRESWRDDGTRSLRDEADRRDLVEYVGPLPQQTTTDTLAQIEEQVADIEQQDEAHTLRAELAQATAARDRLQAELEAMTAERDEQARLRETLDATCRILGGDAKHWKNRAQEISDCMAVEITRAERAEAQVRELRIELDAEGETPANNRRAIAEGHLIGAQTGRQAAFEAVERWLEPLSGVDSEHAAAVLQALPGCIRKLAELEGVTL
jgi:hypothetical protein